MDDEKEEKKAAAPRRTEKHYAYGEMAEQYDENESEDSYAAQQSQP